MKKVHFGQRAMLREAVFTYFSIFDRILHSTESKYSPFATRRLWAKTLSSPVWGGRGWRFSIALLLFVQFSMAAFQPSALAATQSYTISGTTRHHDDTPVQGGFVSTALGDPEMAFATTDDLGNYTLTVTTPGTYHISASFYYNKLDPAPQTVMIPPSQTSVNFTFPQHETIRGVVKDPDGLPLAGATVSTEYTDPIYTSTLTNADGAYTLRVSAGVYHVSVSKDGLVAPPAQRLVVPPSHSDVNFAFFVPYTIQGTVRGFDGQPVSGVSVYTGGDDPMRAYATTDSNGLYTLIVRAGTYHLNAYFLGLGTSGTQIVTVPASRTGVDLEMPQQYLIHGTVRDENGQPVAGAIVNEGATASAATAPDGSYTLSLVAGEHWINAYSNDPAYDSGTNIVLVSVPPTADDVDFNLRVRTRTIRGRVVNDQGKPVTGATVFATTAFDTIGQAEQTDADGTYSLSVPAGVYWVYVVKYFSIWDQDPTLYEPSLSQEIDVSTASAQGVNFALHAVNGMTTIRGRVQYYQGGPLDAMISASPIDPYNCYARETVSTDESGAYTITVKPGTYAISEWSEGLPDQPYKTISVPSAATVDFSYPQLYTIGGQVTNEQGKPLENVLIQVTTNDFNGIYNSALTKNDGWYSIIVAAGSYTVTAYEQGFNTPPVQRVTVLPEHNDINFVLSPATPPTHLIQGRVVDELGQPAATTLISVVGEAFSGKTVHYNGAFSRAAYPGTYTLVAGGNGYTSSSPQQVTVPQNQTDLTFTVRRADHFIFGQVTNEAGDPLCGVKVEAIGEGVSTFDSTGGSGRFALRVPAGSYSVRVVANGYSGIEQAVTLPPTVTQLNFALAAAANKVEGTVLDDKGAAVAGATVTASGAGGNVSTTTNMDGKYTLQLADGRWEITINGAGLVISPASRTVSVPPQQIEIDFQAQVFAANDFVYLPAIITSP